MAIPHAASGDLADVRPLGASIHQSKTSTLLKTDHLEVIRLVLAAGKKIATHAVEGEATVQCLEGRVDFFVGKARHELTPGWLLYLAGSQEHAVQAQEDSSLLVTILLTHKNTATR